MSGLYFQQSEDVEVSEGLVAMLRGLPLTLGQVGLREVQGLVTKITNYSKIPLRHYETQLGKDSAMTSGRARLNAEFWRTFQDSVGFLQAAVQPRALVDASTLLEETDEFMGYLVTLAEQNSEAYFSLRGNSATSLHFECGIRSLE